MAGAVWRAVAAMVVGLAGAALAQAAGAETWVPAARGANGAVFEIDLDSARRDGQTAQTWVRQTLARPERDSVAGKSYLTELDQRFDDCRDRRFQITQATRRDSQGRVVSSGPVATGWRELSPESVAEGIWRVACRIGDPPADKPLLANISQGRWVRTGLSADKSYYISFLFDRVMKLDDDHVAVANRSDFIGYSPIHGYPIKYMVQVSMVDCRRSEIALFGTDTYMTADVRAESARTPAASLKFEPIAPGSLMANAVKDICESAISAPGPAPAPKPSGKETEASKIFSGTAWGVTKGYLVTASHVIKDGSRIEVYSDGQPVGLATVVADDAASDVAILKLRPLHPGQLVVLPLAGHAAVLGRNVFTLGYPAPDILGQHVKMTAGVVSGTTGIEDNARLMQISVPIQPGNSGGPVLGWDGEVVGVADSSIGKFEEDGPPAQNVNYAVKASYVRAMLEDLPDLGGYIVVKPVADHEAMVASARKAVFMLVVTQ